MTMPVLRRLEPELAHRVAMRGLRLLRPVWSPPRISTDIGVNAFGLRFAHPVGIAAGFEFELAWAPNVLTSMDYTYRERHGEARYRLKDGMLPSDFLLT